MEEDRFSEVLTSKPDDLVGRSRELEILLAVLSAGEHILLEGAPGTSKSTLLRFVSNRLNVPLYQIEGSADLTPSKLVGTFNPNLVLEEGFQPDFFEPGPLFRSMDEGGIFYIDELNRAAPDATNVLIRAMEEQELVIPRYGTVKANSGFRVIAAMNPFDDTGVTRISRALFDRLCRIKMDYQTHEEEIEIVKQHLKTNSHNSIIEIGTKIARATRFDDRLRQGASVRGAVDFANIAPKLALIRGGYSSETILDSALVAFTGKIWLENPNLSEEDIILEIVEAVLRGLNPEFFNDLNLDLKKKDRQDLMDEILEELGRLSTIDEDDLLDILNQTLGSGEEDENGKEKDFNPEDEYEGQDTDILAEIDLVGDNFWDNVTEFGDKTREIATQLILRFVEGTFGKSRSLPIYQSRPMRGDDIMELDIETTLDRIIEEPHSEVTPWVFERQKTRNPVVLLMDTSFSMSGKKIMIAGITVGVLSRLIPSQDFCVMGFSRNPFFIKRFEEDIPTYYMINRIMKLLPKGPTNISEALRLGSELIHPFHPYAKLIMLSDADPTAGKNPIPEASKLHQLDLMLFPNGNKWMAERLVFETQKGNLYEIHTYDDIPSIITQIFRIS